MAFDRPITIAVILFIILLLIFFLVAPKYHLFKEFQQKIGEEQAAYDAKFAYYSEIDNVYQQIQAKKDIVDKIGSAIPSNVAYGPLVYFFQKKAMENGMIVRGLFLTKAAPVNPDSALKEIGFSLDVLGSYSALKSFMASLEKSSRLFEVANISFGSSGVSSAGQLQALQIYPFKLEVKTYSY
ncbi:MAG: type 4a pilus biogenesis protein PilO [Patescibacteria group bacterium]